jgi:hypothetical protein
VEKEIKQAFKTWSLVCPNLEFNEVNHEEDADIKIDWSDKGDTNLF